MYSFFSFLVGALIAVMISLNGSLTGVYGLYSSSVFIHITGLIVIAAIVIKRREKPFAVNAPFIMYMGGVLGIAVTAFNNVCFGKISVSAILSIELLGQTLTGLAVDQWGWMDMPVRRMEKKKLIGIALVICGILYMLDDFKLLPVVLCLLCGAFSVLSRTLNAQLTARSSESISTFFNYFTGLVGSIVLFLFLGLKEPAMQGIALDPRIYIYIGGPISVITVWLLNITVRHVSAFKTSLLLFVGQGATALLVDTVIEGSFDPKTLVGVVLVTAGLIVNELLTKKSTVPTDNN